MLCGKCLHSFLHSLTPSFFHSFNQYILDQTLSSHCVELNYKNRSASICFTAASKALSTILTHVMSAQWVSSCLAVGILNKRACTKDHCVQHGAFSQAQELWSPEAEKTQEGLVPCLPEARLYNIPLDHLRQSHKFPFCLNWSKPDHLI